MSPLLLLATSSLGFWSSLFASKTVHLPATNKDVSLFGAGPPVFFSSGLFGTMPRRLYTQLFDQLMGNVTLVVLNDPTPVTRRVFEETATELGVDRLCLFSHSALDASILLSARLEGAVLCDPVTIPPLPWNAPAVASETNHVERPKTLVVKAAHAYDPQVSTPIPDFLFPDDIRSDSLVEWTASDVGHSDLLDDRWAELGTLVLPWMRGPSPTVVPFAQWSTTPTKRASSMRAEHRATYRSEVATKAIDLFTAS